MGLRRFLGAALLAVSLVGGWASASTAASIPVFSRSGLGGNDFIDWGVLGPPFATFVSNPFNISSNSGGRSTQVSKPADSFRVMEQSTSWSGNFAPGDKLLWTMCPCPSLTSITIQFNTPVRGAGAQIQDGQYGGFTGFMDVFNTGGTLMTTVSALTNGTANADNSALFLGILSDGFDIGSIRFRTGGPGHGADFAINRFDLVTTSAAVPEPASLLLLGTGLAGLAGYGWRRQRRT